MKKRLFLYTTLIIFAGLLVFFAASIYITHNNNVNIAKGTVIEATRICADLYGESMDVSQFVKAGDDTRITVIAPDGTVLADSTPLAIGLMENHLNRPEIQAALSGSPATYVRHSDTLGVDFIYYALQVDCDDSYVFVRTAIPVAMIDTYLSQSLPMLIMVLLVVAVLCFVFSRGLINRITKPFASVEQKLRLLSSGGNMSAPIPESYEEIDSIVREIDEVAQILQHSMTALRDEKAKAEYILNNIGDGIFAVDADKNIALINNAVLGIFDLTPDIIGKNINYLTFDKSLIDAVDDCMSHEKNTLFEAALNGRIYLVTVKRLPGTILTMVIMSDITESREYAKHREEFFANASHELKTPLTAIKGFNELLVLHNKDEDVRKYIDSITRETDRMLSLIGDMLRLSELENTQDINPSLVSLAQVVNEVCDTLSAVISEKSISIEITGDGSVKAESGHVYELVKNIIENAVRYNNQGGKVTIAIENEKKYVKLLVSDDGIGIPPEEQTRIFERFYRVEKSRSGRSGGTGLGLSIVKHICALYGWNLSLKSKLGLGTEVSVVFGM